LASQVHEVNLYNYFCDRYNHHHLSNYKLTNIGKYYVDRVDCNYWCFNRSQLGNCSETEDKWSPVSATQLAIAQRPGFDWDAPIQMAPGVNAFVHDTYLLGEGSLHASLLGLFTVAKMHGAPENNRGELLRFFAEAPWYPTALLPRHLALFQRKNYRD
jgi:hypothetical protein